MRVFPFSLLFLAGIVACDEIKNYRRYHVLSTQASTEEQLTVLRNLENQYELVFLRDPSLTLSTDIVVSPEQTGRLMKTLRDAGLTVTVQSSDLQADIDKEQSQNRVNEERDLELTRAKQSFDPKHSHYRNMTMVNRLMKDFQQHYDKLVVMKQMKHTTHGNMIVNYLEVGTPTDANGNDNKPVIILEVLAHAREWIGTASTLYSIDQMLRGFKNGTKEMVDALTDFTWVFIPVTNPDGYIYTWNGNRMWRKNRRPTRGSCVGVDLNRNYDIKFGEIGVSSNCNSDIYPGEKAFSEKETQNVRDLFMELKPRIVSFLSVHAYSQLLLHPWAYSVSKKSSDKPDNIDKLLSVGKLMINALEHKGRNYTLGTPYEVLGYAASGGAEDWALQEKPGIYAYCYELRPQNYRDGHFVLDQRHIVPNGEELLASLLVLAKSISMDLQGR